MQNCDTNNQKIYPQPAEGNMQANNDSADSLIGVIFSNISSLKSAYIQLQDAHTPYDPDRIQAADKLVIQELSRLSELKHSYRDRYPLPISGSPQDTQLLEEIQEQQNLLKNYDLMVKKFLSQIQTRDSEISRLKQLIEEAKHRKAKLEKKLNRRGLLSSGSGGSDEEENYFSVELTTDLFTSAVNNAYKSIHEFAKILINLMKVAGWDLDAAAKAIEPTVVYVKRAHKKFAFESYICERMFSGFQDEGFTVKTSMATISNEGSFHQYLALRSMDPLDILSQNPGSVFGAFCRSKYLLLVQPKMEGSFFGNMDQRNFVIDGGHPRTAFYRAFLRLAKSTWLVHRLAHSFDPIAKIFQVRKGSEFLEIYMETVVKDIVLSDKLPRPKVGLMVAPGFMVGNSVIQSQVYLSDVRCAE